MAWTHSNQTANPESESHSKIETAVTALAKDLAPELQKGCCRVELEATKGGRGGYRSTGDNWHVPPDDVNKETAERDAKELAQLIVDTCTAWVEEHGVSSFKVSMLSENLTTGQTVVLGTSTLGRSIFDSFAKKKPAGDDRESEVVDVLRVMKELVTKLGDVNVELQKATPKVLAEATTFVLGLLKEAGEQKQGSDLETMRLLMTGMKEQRDDTFAHERWIEGKRTNAKFAQSVIEAVGPRFADAIFQWLESKGYEVDRTYKGEAPNEDPVGDRQEKREKSQRSQYQDVISELSDETLEKLKGVLGEDLWSVVAAASVADSDSDFDAQLEKLKELYKQMNKAEAAKIGFSLMSLLPKEAQSLFQKLLQST